MTSIALTIAGSDSGGGAGIQADLKTFSALGVYGTSAITAITAQNTLSVTAIEELTPHMVAAQIDAVLSDMAVNAIKIGMLSSPQIIATVAEHLKIFTGPIVLDPVMIAKSGDALLLPDAVSTLISKLLPMATVLTPNLPEAARLLGQAKQAETPEEIQAQGMALLDMGPKAILMKGGHATGAICTDLLITPNKISKFEVPRIATKNTHGTGCTLSSAIAAGLAKGYDLETSVGKAHAYLKAAIVNADSLNIGAGHGPVHHFHHVWDQA